MITVRLIGVDGKQLHIDKEGAAATVVHPHPPLDEDVHVLPFRQYFTADGLSGGPNSLIVAGSLAAPVPFWIPASSDHDIFVKSISVEIGDTGNPNLNLFGTLAALPNGVKFSHYTQKEGEYILHEGIKTNKEFVRIGVDTGAIGTGTDAYLADVSGGGGEKSYLPIINFDRTNGMPYGLRLRKGTKDKVAFTLQDPMAGLTTFNIIGNGIRI